MSEVGMMPGAMQQGHDHMNPPPAGVMGAHIVGKGKVMLMYTPMFMKMDGSRIGTRRVAFDGTPCPEGARGAGTRRIELVQVDPLAWYEALPELFREPLSDVVPDDGLWDGLLVRRRMNELLERELDSGRYRLAGLAGVVDDVLREVHVEELDERGRVQRRLFADRLSVRATESGLLLFLEDGVQVRGGRKQPFLEGRFRIFLPRAPRAEWERAGVPGLCPVADSPLAAQARG